MGIISHISQNIYYFNFSIINSVYIIEFSYFNTSAGGNDDYNENQLILWQINFHLTLCISSIIFWEASKCLGWGLDKVLCVAEIRGSPEGN